MKKSIHNNSDEQRVKKLFNSITATYDFLNRLMSLRQDVRWRRRMVNRIPEKSKLILDVATGTGDVALEALKQNPTLMVTGIDFAINMLRAARRKFALTNYSSKVDLLNGNALHLPFKSSVFDAVTIAFGLRNIINRALSLREMRRVLKPNGKVIILEITFAPHKLARPFFRLYMNLVLPLLGALIARDRRAYTYLPESISSFLNPEELTAMMIEVGFIEVQSSPIAMGIVYLHTGIKTADKDDYKVSRE